MSISTGVNRPRLVIAKGDGWHEARAAGQHVTANGAELDWEYYGLTPPLTPFGEKLAAAVSDLPEQGIPVLRLLGYGIRYSVVPPLTWDDADTLVATAFAAAYGGAYDVEYDDGDYDQAECIVWGPPR